LQIHCLIIEELAGQADGKLKVAKLNVDDHPVTASRYGIEAFLNLIILKDGAVKEQIVGAVPKAKLVAATHAIQQNCWSMSDEMEYCSDGNR
jgi:thioredoxin 1